MNLDDTGRSRSLSLAPAATQPFRAGSAAGSVTVLSAVRPISPAPPGASSSDSFRPAASAPSAAAAGAWNRPSTGEPATDDPGADEPQGDGEPQPPGWSAPSAGQPETPERPPAQRRVPEDEQTARAAFEAFFENHHRELARLALLLTGNKEDAEDITADALTSAWMHWDRVQAAENSLAYVRRSVANLAASQVRRRIRQRNLLTRVGRQQSSSTTSEPDVPQAMLLQWALDQLPHRKRQCVVLRYGLDLSEAETAEWLGISVGTVKSQTSKAVSELERLLTAGAGAGTDAGAGAPNDGGGRHQRRPARPGVRGTSRKGTARGRQGRASAPSEPTRTAFMWLRGGEA